MLQFHDQGGQNLANYGFNDQTTSWRNNRNAFLDVYDNTSYTSELWYSGKYSTSSNVGSTNNDRASSFRVTFH